VADVETKWHVEIDADICISSLGCVTRVPEAFERVDRKSCVRHALMAPMDLVLESAETCPVEAITIREEGTGRLIFPPEE
jgi:ferredoxin